MTAVLSMLAFLTVTVGALAAMAHRRKQTSRLLVPTAGLQGEPSSGTTGPGSIARRSGSGDRAVIAEPGGRRGRRWRAAAGAVGLGAAGAIVGYRLAALPGLVVLGAVSAAIQPSLSSRRAARGRERLDRQLADLIEATAAALRSGLSIHQALQVATDEADQPMEGLAGALMADIRLGSGLDQALARFADDVGTDDARLFVMVMGIHARTGGDLATALNEVLSTIRDRLSIRRDLRALTAQGRLSGAILGAVPLGFFLFLAVTSHRELAPVYRSFAGMAMVGAGLVLEGLAFLWIRRLLRVEV
jgi:tight adherence protein B